MITRRSVLKVGLGLCSCAACGLEARATAADPQVNVDGRGYTLHFLGAQRETVTNGKLDAVLDLRSLANTPHLYGIGPIAQLRGEVTIANSRPALARVGPDRKVSVQESFESGVPFFVWAEVPSWHVVPLPSHVRSQADLERVVPEAAASIGLDPNEPLPFLLRGRADFIEFHVLNRIGDEPHDAHKHRNIQMVFEAARQEAIVVGFYSPRTRGIFTPMDSSIHLHFQSSDNKVSGHIQKMSIDNDMTLAFPSA